MKTSQQFIIFAGVGAIGTAGHYAVLILLIQFFHIAPVTATSAGFVTGALINYMLNYHVTFNSDKRHREAITKFLTVAFLGALLNGTMMSLGIHVFELHYLIAQVIATCIVLTLNFIASKHWTFAVNKA